MTGQPSPLARPDLFSTMLTFSRAWPSPLWAYNTFSYVLCLSLRITHLVLFSSFRFYSLRFDSIHFALLSLAFRLFLYPARDLSSLYIYKPLYD